MSKPTRGIRIEEMVVIKCLENHGIINISLLRENLRIKEYAKHEMPGFQTSHNWYIYI